MPCADYTRPPRRSISSGVGRERSRLSDALVSHGVTVVTEAAVFRLHQAEDAARRRLGCASGGFWLNVAVVWLGRDWGDREVSGGDRFIEGGRAQERSRARLSSRA